MKLIAVTQTLQVKLGEAVDTVPPTYSIESMTVVASTVALVASPSTIEAGDFTPAYADAALATIASQQKGVTRLHFTNSDTVAHSFFLRRLDSGTGRATYFLFGQVMDPGEFCTYEVGMGFAFFDIFGNKK